MDENDYHDPSGGIFGNVFGSLCNCSMLRRIRRATLRLLPFLKLRSNVTGIIYLNWVVGIEDVQPLVPKGIKLLDVGGKTIFSILTYKHGNFRPAIAELLKSAFPSPLQSNWRLYVKSVGGTSVDGAVLFTKNIMNERMFVVGTRLSSDAMLTHYARKFSLKMGEKSIELGIDPESGSSPDLFVTLEHSSGWRLPIELVEYFGTERQLLEYLCRQHFALTKVPDIDGLCKADIELPIEICAIRPLAVAKWGSEWLTRRKLDSEPFAFLVPNVDFEVLNESIIRPL